MNQFESELSELNQEN